MVKKSKIPILNEFTTAGLIIIGFAAVVIIGIVIALVLLIMAFTQ